MAFPTDEAVNRIVATARHWLFLPSLLSAALALLLLSGLELLPPFLLAAVIALCMVLLGVLLSGQSAGSGAGPLPMDLALEALGEACLIADAEGRIHSANSAAAHMFGFTPEELRDQSVDLLLPERMRTPHHPDDHRTPPRHRLLHAAKSLAARRRDGSEFAVQVSLRPLDAGKDLVAVTLRDLSALDEPARIRDRLSAIVENTTDLVAIADTEERLYYMNAAGRALLGVKEALPPNLVDCFTDCKRLEREVLPQARKRGMWSGELELQHTEGHALPVSLVLVAHRRADGAIDFYSASARDITDHLRSEARLRRLNRTYAVLSRCNHSLTQAGSEQELTREFCTALVETGGYRMAWFGVGQDDPERTVTPLVHAGHEAGYLQQARISWSDRTDRGLGPTGIAIRTGQITLGADTAQDPRFRPWREAAQQRGYRSSIALPVLDRDSGLRGCLMIYSPEVDAFDTEEITLLAELAGDLNFGIQALRTRDARQAAESLSRLRNHVIEASRNGVLITEAKGPLFPIIYANAAFERITGYTRAEALGRNPNFLLSGDNNQPALEDIRAALRQGTEGRATLRNHRKDGTVFWNDLFIVPVRSDTGAITHFAGIIDDVTERRLYEEQLEYQANHDPLTGLPNRTLMSDRLTQLVAASLRHDRPLAVLFLDLDQFKFINDSLGHRVGDELLKIAAGRLATCIREVDTLSRYGGDEFVLLLPDLIRPEDVSTIARRILHTMEQPMTVDGRQLQATVSIGASMFPRDGTDADALLKNADAAMYRAKEMGRNNLQFYTEELNERALDRITIETELRNAIDRNELVLHYQPRVDLQTGRIVGCEALVRWQHPERGLVPPAKFIAIAEETGLIGLLGEWVLVEAAAQNRTWQEMGLPAITVAVNVSARQLTIPDLPARVVSVLKTTGLSAEDLELEITESAIMRDAAAMSTRLQQLKATGTQLSMDDFGTGYSSLSYLSSFPFDALKIDQSFVRNITTSPHDAEIALAIIALAHSLKLRVIAEGVETEGQLRYLQRHGCDEFQGYYFSRPVTAEQFAEMLRNEKVLPPCAEMQVSAATILLVDDEPNILDALRRVLRRESYRLLTAGSAREGFEMLAQNEVDVVISDQRMPETTGVEFLSSVKEIYPDTVRLVLSGYSDQAVVIDAFNRGDIYRFIQKPWDNAHLRREVREAVLRRRAALER